jgi:hypothetical protein
MQEQQASSVTAFCSSSSSNSSRNSSSSNAEPKSAREIMSPSPELGSSGYSSDADISKYDHHHQVVTRNDGEPSSISSDSSDYNSDAENEDIDIQISFLQEKQRILKRAFALFKEEENYDASRARLILAGKVSRGSPIWLEAKEVLEDLEEERLESQAAPKKVKLSSSDTSSRSSAWTAESCQRDPNLPKIDLSSVIRISSAEIGDDLIAAAVDAIKRDVLSVPFAMTGPWMAKMLVRCLPSLPAATPTSTTKPAAAADSVNWVIVNDPSMGPIVVPPSKIPFQNKIHLKEAIACTTVAQ